MSTTRQIISTVVLLALAATSSLALARSSADASKKRVSSGHSKIVSNARVRQALVVRTAKHGKSRRLAALARVEPARPSMGQLIGLHEAVLLD